MGCLVTHGNFHVGGAWSWETVHSLCCSSKLKTSVFREKWLLCIRVCLFQLVQMQVCGSIILFESCFSSHWVFLRRNSRVIPGKNMQIQPPTDIEQDGGILIHSWHLCWGEGDWVLLEAWNCEQKLPSEIAALETEDHVYTRLWGPVAISVYATRVCVCGTHIAKTPSPIKMTLNRTIWHLNVLLSLKLK